MADPIRILHVFAQMNRGGAETMIMDLYRNIDRSKIQFDFIVHTEEKCAFDEEIEQLGGKIFSIPVYNGKNHFHYIKCWKHFLNNHPDYKIMHGHIRSTASIYLKIAKQFGLVTISHSHSTSNGTGFRSIVKNLLQYRIRYISDYYFAASIDAGNWLFGNAVVNSKKFFVLNNGIDAQKYTFNHSIRSQYREKLDVKGKFVIGHVGNFKKPKNHLFLLDIFKSILNTNPDSVLLLVGDGPLKENIYDQVVKLGLEEKIKFLGIRDDVNNIMQAMDVFLFPSVFEGLGIVAIESQASGLPTIVSNGIPKEAYITKLIENIDLSVSVEHWAKKVLKYQEGYHRENTLNEIVNAGFDVNNTVLELQNYYLGLM